MAQKLTLQSDKESRIQFINGCKAPKPVNIHRTIIDCILSNTTCSSTDGKCLHGHQLSCRAEELTTQAQAKAGNLDG